MSSVVPVVQDMKIYGFQNFESKTKNFQSTMSLTKQLVIPLSFIIMQQASKNLAYAIMCSVFCDLIYPSFNFLFLSFLQETTDLLFKLVQLFWLLLLICRILYNVSLEDIFDVHNCSSLMTLSCESLPIICDAAHSNQVLFSVLFIRCLLRILHQINKHFRATH